MDNVAYYLAFPLRRQRRSIRRIARSAWQLADGDGDKAIELVQDRDLYSSIIAAFLIGVAVNLATKIIMYWILNDYTTIPQTPTTEEPGY